MLHRLSSRQSGPGNVILIGGLALTNIGLGDKAAALSLAERGMAVIPIEKDANPLRNDPRFQKLVASPAQESANK